MKLLYFAWLREKAGIAYEDVSPPESIATVADLIKWQISRGGVYSEVFSDISIIRIAVNQEYVDFEHPISIGDEIAFFPPMTGG
ncbi:MAG: molybdopterin converting factor subunit 1 [Pseudomonadota bacterium]|nr:molybdopterin converting factor subunit 1 [Pseudomonadota bacterium]|tara:strand:+ start:78 stop:329 length:252 start_codon:yes stop_codon:yes gene_type:complete